MDIRLQGTGVELTDEVRAYISRHIGDACRALGSADQDPIDIAVEVEKTTRRYVHEKDNEGVFRAEANVTLPGRKLRAEGSANDLYQAVNVMKHHLTRELRDWREQLIDARREGGRQAKRMR